MIQSPPEGGLVYFCLIFIFCAIIGCTALPIFRASKHSALDPNCCQTCKKVAHRLCCHPVGAFIHLDITNSLFRFKVINQYTVFFIFFKFFFITDGISLYIDRLHHKVCNLKTFFFRTIAKSSISFSGMFLA